MAHVKLVYFAWVRERIGLPEEEVELPPTIATVADLVGWLKTRGEVHARPDAPLAGAREIAFFPPMTGG